MDVECSVYNIELYVKVKVKMKNGRWGHMK